MLGQPESRSRVWVTELAAFLWDPKALIYLLPSERSGVETRLS